MQQRVSFLPWLWRKESWLLHVYSPEQLYVLLYKWHWIKQGWLSNATSNSCESSCPHMAWFTVCTEPTLGTLYLGITVIDQSDQSQWSQAGLLIENAEPSTTYLTGPRRSVCMALLASLIIDENSTVCTSVSPPFRLTKEELMNSHSLVPERSTPPPIQLISMALYVTCILTLHLPYPAHWPFHLLLPSMYDLYAPYLLHRYQPPCFNPLNSSLYFLVQKVMAKNKITLGWIDRFGTVRIVLPFLFQNRV